MNRLAWTYLGVILAAGLVASGYVVGRSSSRCQPPPSCELEEKAAVLEYRLARMDATLAVETQQLQVRPEVFNPEHFTCQGPGTLIASKETRQHDARTPCRHHTRRQP